MTCNFKASLRCPVVKSRTSVFIPDPDGRWKQIKIQPSHIVSIQCYDADADAVACNLRASLISPNVMKSKGNQDLNGRSSRLLQQGAQGRDMGIWTCPIRQRMLDKPAWILLHQSTKSVLLWPATSGPASNVQVLLRNLYGRRSRLLQQGAEGRSTGRQRCNSPILQRMLDGPI